MARIDLTIRTVAPAFLGDADQAGEWRTPPIKALLRQWWRVVRAAAHGYDHMRVREEEGLLFGHAWLGTPTAGRSRVRLQLLDGWRAGTLRQQAGGGQQPPPRGQPQRGGAQQGGFPETQVQHPEVGNPPPRNVGANLYLGYGPLVYQRGLGTVLKKSPVIANGETVRLRIHCPDVVQGDLETVLRCIHWLGTLGGRSRNGWGSIELEGIDIPPVWDPAACATLRRLSRPWRDCLKLDWPHAMGHDDKGLLVWTGSELFPSWEEAMKKLAEVKIAFRTALRFTQPAGTVDRRHLLAYPVTNHPVRSWDPRGGRQRQGRLANQVRFKLYWRDGRIGILVYHLPAKLPRRLLNDLNNAEKAFVTQHEAATWQQVHQKLDGLLVRLCRTQ